jgi:uncharacterized protein (TIGR00661 family)
MPVKRIAYGINGDTLGPTLRASAILPELARKYDVRVFAGGNAYNFLKGSYHTVLTPHTVFCYDSNHNLSVSRTISANWLRIAGLVTGLGTLNNQFRREFDEFAPDFVISDTETWTSRRARKFGIPDLRFDHPSYLAFCDLDLPSDLQRDKRILGFGYKLLFGLADRMIVPNFFPAQAKPRYEDITDVIGPIVRPEVKQAEITDKGHVLVYMSHFGSFPPQFEEHLTKLGIPVKVYGEEKEDHDNLTFHRKSHRPFLEDLASCHAVISRAGNQLPGEMLYLRKPALLIPESHVEQRINAYMWEKMGAGMQADIRTLSLEQITEFLGQHQRFRENMLAHRQDSTGRALELIYQFIDTL